MSHLPPFRSLRARLLAGTSLAICVALLAAGFLLNGLFAEHAARQFAQQLRQQLDHLVAHVEQDAAGRPAIAGTVLSDPRWQAPYSGLYGQIDGDGQRALWRSRSLWDTELQAAHDVLAETDVHVHAAAGPRDAKLLLVERVVRPAGANGVRWRLLVATDRGPLDAAVAEFRGVLAVSLAVLALLLLLAAVAQVQLLLAPLRGLQAALSRVHAGDQRRLTGEHPVELQPLVDRFNDVLASNEALVERARHNAGNLAHAIRTPLAILEQAAATQRATNPDAVDLANQVSTQVAIARRHVDWHLARARADAAGGVPGQRAEVEPVIRALLRVMARLHADRSLRLATGALATDALAAGVAFAGEEQDLQEMVGNLLDNACKWARGAVTVEVMLDDSPGTGLRIVVEDDGPGIAEDARARALARGGRLDESVGGSGLGLAIVADLARSYRGELRLERAAAGGLRAELRLPRAPAACGR